MFDLRFLLTGAVEVEAIGCEPAGGASLPESDSEPKRSWADGSAAAFLPLLLVVDFEEVLGLLETLFLFTTGSGGMLLSTSA